MAKYAFTARSRTGKPVNVITKAPEDTKTVYSRRELRAARRAAARDLRDLEVTVRRLD